MNDISQASPEARLHALLLENEERIARLRAEVERRRSTTAAEALPGTPPEGGRMVLRRGGAVALAAGAAGLAVAGGATPALADDTLPFLGELRLIAFNFAPKYWALCAGQFLLINQNQALFSILGTNFGGNGQTNFRLPDLRGRSIIGVGQGPGLSQYVVGETVGQDAHTLSVNEMPAHNHLASAVAAAGTSGTPTNNAWAQSTRRDLLYSSNANATLSPAALASSGGSQPHENRQPYLVLNYIIALAGVFPSPN